MNYYLKNIKDLKMLGWGWKYKRAHIVWITTTAQTETWTKSEVYLWSHRVAWNNGKLDVARADGNIVYLYMHISQAWPLARKAQGRETKSSHQIAHKCICLCDTHTQTRVSTRSRTQKPVMIEHYRASLFTLMLVLLCSAFPIKTQTSRDDSTL